GRARLLPATSGGSERHQWRGARARWAVARCRAASPDRAAQPDRPCPGARGAAMSAITLAELNSLDERAFTAALANVFEGPPWIVEAVWAERPFESLDALHQALCRVMLAAPSERQVALIRAHPDLVGRAALAGTLSPASTAEQASAGLD